MGLSFGDPAHFFGHGAKAGMFQLSDGDKAFWSNGTNGLGSAAMSQTPFGMTLHRPAIGKKVPSGLVRRLWHARCVRTGIGSRTAHFRRIGKASWCGPGGDGGRVGGSKQRRVGEVHGGPLTQTEDEPMGRRARIPPPARPGSGATGSSQRHKPRPVRAEEV